jgi:hypothetical protein
MRRLYGVLVVSVAILMTTPTLQAQVSNGSVTRAQTAKELEDLEALGYYPTRASALRFPYDVEAAEARLAGKRSGQAYLHRNQQTATDER